MTPLYLGSAVESAYYGPGLPTGKEDADVLYGVFSLVIVFLADQDPSQSSNVSTAQCTEYFLCMYCGHFSRLLHLR